MERIRISTQSSLRHFQAETGNARAGLHAHHSESASGCRSTYKHPSCTVLQPEAQLCCRSRDGQPWPPVPSAPASPDLPITALSKTDVRALRNLRLTRGSSLRQGVPVPFREGWKPRVAACGLLADGTTLPGLREWLDHHKCASNLLHSGTQCILSPRMTDHHTLACNVQCCYTGGCFVGTWPIAPPTVTAVALK
jgi:hypothetical protein